MKQVKMKQAAATALAIVERARAERRLTEEEAAAIAAVLKEVITPKRALAAVGIRGTVRHFHG